MYVKINKPEGHSHNKGTCQNLVEYLDKENEKLSLEEQQSFFNQERTSISTIEAQDIIDSNTAKLGKNDSKFFHVSVNPSKSELEHIASQVTGRKVTNIVQLSKEEFSKYNEALRDYTNNVMDAYARNFNRGLEGKDIVYVAKIEQERKFDRFSKEVKHNREVKKSGGEYMRSSNGEIIKEGMKKEGLQSHVHVVVSRKDQTNKIKLSPFANARNAKNKLDGREVQIGFDREAFVGEAEKRFDHQFSYDREFKHSFQYKHVMSMQYKGAVRQALKQQITQHTGNPKQDLMRELGLQDAQKLSNHTRQLMNIISKGIAPQKIAIDLAKQAVRHTLNL